MSLCRLFVEQTPHLTPISSKKPSIFGSRSKYLRSITDAFSDAPLQKIFSRRCFPSSALNSPFSLKMLKMSHEYTSDHR